MKKRLCALALCLLLISMVLPFAAFAEEPAPTAPELTLATQLSDATLTVTVGLVNNPGIAGFDLVLHFNSEVLTPTGAPSAASGWDEYAATNYTAPFSGDALKLVCVKQTNMIGDCALFTASFTVNNSKSYGLSVSGTACSETADALMELQTVYGDAFELQSVSRTATGVTATIASFGGGFSGDAKAIVSRYLDGKFCGCSMQSITIIKNGITNLNIPCSPGSNETVKLILTDESFRPISPETIDVPTS